MTADQYRASLDDGRETYFEGEQIGNVATQPLLAITVDSAAEGYDRFYDPTLGAVGAFMKVPTSADDLREQVELHETVDLYSYGGWNAVTNIQVGGGLYAQRIVSRMYYDMERAKQTALKTAGMEEFADRVV